MIPISDYKSYFKRAVERIPELRTFKAVVDENHLGKVVKDLNNTHYPLLVAAYPSAITSADSADAIKGRCTGLLFVLFDMNDRSRSDHDYESELDQASQIMTTLVGIMREDMQECSFMANLHTDSMKIDPEYNFVGHVGVSCTFSFDAIPSW